MIIVFTYNIINNTYTITFMDVNALILMFLINLNDRVIFRKIIFNNTNYVHNYFIFDIT